MKYDHEEYNTLQYESIKQIFVDYAALSNRKEKMKFHAELTAISESMKKTKNDYLQNGKDLLADFIHNVASAMNIEDDITSEACDLFLSFEFLTEYPLIEDDSPNIDLFNEFYHQTFVVYHSFFDCYHFKERLGALKSMTKQYEKEFFSSEIIDFFIQEFEALQRFYCAYFEVSARHGSVFNLCDLLDRKGYDYEITTETMNENKRNRQPQNEFARGLQRKKQENAPIKEQIINQAADIIKGSDRTYLTPSGKAQRWLWKHPKIKKFGNGNSRGWIDKAIEDGKL